MVQPKALESITHFKVLYVHVVVKVILKLQFLFSAKWNYIYLMQI